MIHDNILTYYIATSCDIEIWDFIALFQFNRIVILSIHLGHLGVNNLQNQTQHSFITQTTKTVKLGYLLFLPSDYKKNADQKFPLIMFLHGMGERGDENLNLLKTHGIPKIVETTPNFPCIVVSPQCPDNSWWTMETDALKALLDEIIDSHSVNPDQIYLTGLSMGGYGTWKLATEHPDYFAAIAPICGGGDPEKAEQIKDIPIWVFHGAKDLVVTLEKSEEMVESLKLLNGNVRFTVYPETEHDSWTKTYDNPELYEWFFQHTRLRKQ